MLRAASTLLLLLSPILAEENPAPAAAPPASTPAIKNADLVGTWHLDMAMGEAKVKGHTEYKADGTFQGRATLVVEEETTELTVKGTWKLDGQTLATTITESNNPDLLPVGEVSKDQILELNASTLRYRDEDGLVIRETREDPKAGPPAKSPGKPVPPEDIKAIHAAIAAMQRSFHEADYDGIVKGTHPSLIGQIGGEEKFRKSLENAVDMIQSGKIKIGDDQLDPPPAELHEAGDEWVCFVPKRNTIEFDGRKVRSQGFYVAVRKKADKEWKLLDGAGFRDNPEMLWTLLPALPQGVEIPPVKREIVAEE
jgi:hypothetical protein